MLWALVSVIRCVLQTHRHAKCTSTLKKMQTCTKCGHASYRLIKASTPGRPVSTNTKRPPRHCAFFFASLARPLARMLMDLFRNILSAIGSGTSEMRSHTTACTQYGVHRGSYPMWRTAARAYVSGDGASKVGFLMDANFVATCIGTWWIKE